jgi:hypothetical protein
MELKQSYHLVNTQLKRRQEKRKVQEHKKEELPRKFSEGTDRSFGRVQQTPYSLKTWTGTTRGVL